MFLKPETKITAPPKPCIACGGEAPTEYRAWQASPLCGSCFLSWETSPEVRAVSKLNYRADTASAYREATKVWLDLRRGAA